MNNKVSYLSNLKINTMKSIILFSFSLFLFISNALQAQNVVFIFSAPEGQEIIKINEEKHEKSVDFFVTGLNTTNEVSALVQKITTMAGVKAFTISENVVDGKRAATGVFEICGSVDFFKTLLNNAGVEDLIINGENVKSAELQKVWKTNPDANANPTGGPKTDEQIKK